MLEKKYMLEETVKEETKIEKESEKELSLKERINRVCSLQRPFPGSLYHYTTGSGFLGIIQEKEIWATSIHYMNDSKEFRLAFDIARNIIQDVRKNRNDTILLDCILNHLKNGENVNVCVASFSENKDQLSQWRAYSGDYGFSIGFRPEHLNAMAADQNFYLAPCIYERKEQENIIKEIINFHIEKFHEKAMVGYGDEVRDDAKYISYVISKFIEYLVGYSPIIKDRSFAEECEWRLISIPLQENHSQMAYRSGRSMIIPYFRYKLYQIDKSLQLDGVIVGPTPHTDIAIRAAWSALTKYNVTTPRPQSSSTPYRNW